MFFRREIINENKWVKTSVLYWLNLAGTYSLVVNLGSLISFLYVHVYQQFLVTDYQCLCCRKKWSCFPEFYYILWWKNKTAKKVTSTLLISVIKRGFKIVIFNFIRILTAITLSTMVHITIVYYFFVQNTFSSKKDSH